MATSHPESPTISEGVPSDPPTVLSFRADELTALRERAPAIADDLARIASAVRDQDEQLREAELYIEAIRRPLLWYFGTTDPDLFAEVLADRDAATTSTPLQGESSPPSENLDDWYCDGFGCGYVNSSVRIRCRACKKLRPAAPIAEERKPASDALCEAARAFCAELQEDADGVPQAELAALHRALDAHENEEPTSWRCFHCDEVLTTEDDAALHFGVRSPLSFSKPGCIEKLSVSDTGQLLSLRALEERNRTLVHRAANAEEAAEGYAGLRSELRRYFGHEDAWSCWNVLDSMKGRALAAEGHVTELLDAGAMAGIALDDPDAYVVDRIAHLVTALRAARPSSKEPR